MLFISDGFVVMADVNTKYVCGICGYIYDPAEGNSEMEVAPGTSFADLPDDWGCPLCGVNKSEFYAVD